MKKRWISIALALLMIMSLLPFGALAADTSLSDELAQNLAAVQGVDFSGADFSAGNDGAVALASGTGAFNYLKQKAINDGFSSNGTYMCVLQTSTSGNVTTSVLVAYTPEDDIIGLIENATNSTNSNYVHRVTLFIPSDLSMPYMAYQDSEIRGSSTDYARAWTSVNSSYTSESTLTLSRGEGKYYLDNFEPLFRSSLNLILTTTELEFVKNSSYSIADLGFTAFAQELKDHSSSTPTPEPTPKPTAAPSGAAQGAVTDTINWSVKNGVLTISGSGAVPTYGISDDRPWKQYQKEIHTLIVEDGITAIGERAFSHLTALKTVSLPESLKILDEWCFYNDKALEEIVIPEGVRSIESAAFYGCSLLETVWLPGTLKTIGFHAFHDCNLLSDIYYNGTPDDWSAIKLETNEEIDNATIHYNSAPAPVTTPAPTAEPTTEPTTEPTVKPTQKPDVSGESVFDYLKQVAIRDGEYQEESSRYIAILHSDGEDTVGLVYYTDDDILHLILSSKKVSSKAISEYGTTLVIPSDLTMPYQVTESIKVDGGEAAYGITQVDSSFTVDSDLTILSGSGFYKDPSFKKVIASGLEYLLTRTQAECLINGPYTIADLGFTALAKKIGIEPSPKPTPTPDPSPEPSAKPTQQPSAQNPFKDVAKDQYYYEPVLWAVNHTPQITQGTSADAFSPDATCTRGQVVTFLWRAAGEPKPTGTKNPFTDVKSSDYFYNAVLWAVEKGITQGTSATTFSPNDPCTRAHVVTFLWRSEGQNKADAKNPFTDVKSGDYYYDAVLWAVKNGITQGTSATTFSPSNPCTRGQIVTFLYRDMK